MSDIEITHGSEFMVWQAEGQTDAGTSFIDGYIPERDATVMTVVDSGRIVLPDTAMDDFIRKARERGLEISKQKARV